MERLSPLNTVTSSAPVPVLTVMFPALARTSRLTVSSPMPALTASSLPFAALPLSVTFSVSLPMPVSTRTPWLALLMFRATTSVLVPVLTSTAPPPTSTLTWLKPSPASTTRDTAPDLVATLMTSSSLAV